MYAARLGVQISTRFVDEDDEGTGLVAEAFDPESVVTDSESAVAMAIEFDSLQFNL